MNIIEILDDLQKYKIKIQLNIVKEKFLNFFSNETNIFFKQKVIGIKVSHYFMKY